MHQRSIFPKLVPHRWKERFYCTFCRESFSVFIMSKCPTLFSQLCAGFWLVKRRGKANVVIFSLVWNFLFYFYLYTAQLWIYWANCQTLILGTEILSQAKSHISLLDPAYCDKNPYPNIFIRVEGFSISLTFSELDTLLPYVNQVYF